DDIEHSRIEEVDAGDGPIARRILRFFKDLDDAIAFESRDTVAFRIGHLLQHDARAALLSVELLYVIDKRIFKDIVAKDDTDLLPRRELFTQRERLGDAPCLVLHAVGEFKIEVMA